MVIVKIVRYEIVISVKVNVLGNVILVYRTYVACRDGVVSATDIYCVCVEKDVKVCCVMY